MHVLYSGFIGADVPTTNRRRLLMERLDARLNALGLSDNDASKRTGKGRDLIRDLRRNPDRSPLIDTIMLLAQALECSVDYLINPETTDPTAGPLPQPEPADTLPVVGLVGAELWQAPRQIDRQDLGKVRGLMIDKDAESGERYALRVTGDAMNRIAPDGSYVIVLQDPERPPRDEDLIVIQRHANGLVERSLRRVRRRDGQLELHCDSTGEAPEPLPYDPEHTAIEGFVEWIVQRPS
jgi:transcriptional regulator with XRE-family HTH domain